MNIVTKLYNYASVSLNGVNLPKTSLGQSRLTTALDLFLGVAGSVALLIIVISSFRMVISKGNPQDITKSRDTIIYATIGLVICMSAYAIVTFVVGGL